MKFLFAIAIGCALLLGLHHGASSGAAGLGAPPPAERSYSTDEGVSDEPGPETGDAYECKYSPYCQRATQCTAYCAGGIPVCSQGCCACAS